MNNQLVFGTIIVTRPKPLGEPLIRALEELSYATHYHPFISITPLELDDTAKEVLRNIPHYDGVIFTSQHAVTFTLDTLRRFFPEVPAVNWFAVGNATKATLQPYCQDIITPQTEQSSHGLLELPELRTVDQKRLLIIKGKGGRTLLQETLKERGAIVDTLDCYQRNESTDDTQAVSSFWQEEVLPLVILTSNSSLDVLHKQMTQAINANKLVHTPLIVVSERTKKHAKSLGYEYIVLAKGASDQAIIDAVQSIPPRG